MSVEIYWRDKSKVKRKLKRLKIKTQHLEPVFRTIGAYLVSSTQERIDTQRRSPTGVPWAELSPQYLQEKLKRSSGGILQDTGSLLRSIISKASSSDVSVGSPLEYACIHQFGGKIAPHTIKPLSAKALVFNGRFAKSVQHPGSRIVARPFLGISEDDSEIIIELVKKHYGNN